MSAAFDLSLYADDIAEMRLEHDFYQVRLAQSLALLATAERWRHGCAEAMRLAEARLEVALDDAIAAHRDADEAAGVVLDACRLVTLVRGER